MNPIPKLLLALMLLGAGATPALAAWPNQPSANLPVITLANHQSIPRIVSDGDGGAIIIWLDLRSGVANDLYAQHILASGVVDPAWPATGLAFCTAVANQNATAMISDGAGGAIVAWQDLRGGGTYDLYAQHVLSNGTVDPAWPVDGRALCTATGDQTGVAIVSDGAAGAIVAWQDARGGATTDIYAQHLQSFGTVDPAWPLDGRALCTSANNQTFAALVSDGAGGALVSWLDLRGGATNDVYAQRVLASGAVDPAWPVNGRPVCAASGEQTLQSMVSDGVGGAILSWNDLRGGVANDIYAQHLLSTGSVDPVWPLDGRAVCTAAQTQTSTAIASDGAGGAIIAWHDLRGGLAYDIYAQHVPSWGVVDPAWPVDGRALCTATNSQYNTILVSDGDGGAIAAWQDLRNGGLDCYAQRVLASGVVDTAWPTNGRAICTATGDQQSPVIASDGAGGALLAWYDLRNGSTYDIYGQRVARHGYLGTPEAELAGVKDVANDNGGKVKVSWNASWLDLAQDANLATYDVLRSVPASLAALRLARGERPAASLAELQGSDRMIALPSASQGYYWELLGSVAALHYVSGYSYIAPVLADSIGAGNPMTAFMVVARNAAGSMFWPSRPDSGYSVDNLPPAAPAPFTANYSAGTAYLHWNRNTEADLAGYRLYRGSSVAFVPGPANLVSSLPDTGTVDAAGAPYVYKLTAIDTHGNESPVATIVPTGTLGVGDGEPLSLSFAAPSPNPARGKAALRYTLSRAGHVRLSVFDAAGRRVAVLHDGEQTAGEHAASFTLDDAAGRELASGLYLIRLEAEGRVITRRLATVR